jgi:NTE family protein
MSRLADGCGVLAATHVGALRALERHGLNYGRVQTYAGVSAGAVVSAMLAVGCCADEVHDLIVKLDFQRLVRPELGSLLRCGANLLLSSLLQISAASSDTLLERGHGPGVNSGRVLEDMVGEALRAKTGDAGITLGQVLTKFGKRLVLIATELDSGKERRLTPENDAHLPVRVAVRMSMGIPGAFEPFKYQGHLYCDGGMINDFPITALPDKAHRLGLCVKQKSYVSCEYSAITN